MYIRLFAVALATLVIAQLSMAQGSSPGAGDSQQYRLSGVLVSDKRKTALLNGRLVHEGANVGGAIIESIDAREIQVRFGTVRQRVRIGGSFTAGPSGKEDRAMMVVRRSAPVNERLANTSGDRARAAPKLEDSSRSYSVSVRRSSPVHSAASPSQVAHVVARGETLSGIALHYRPDGITINQMMLALFEANPTAFSGNINRLSAGATLYIPDSSEAGGHSVSAAMAEVTRQNEDWRQGSAGTVVQLASTGPPIDEAVEARNDTYGPVRRGDTLSDIALDLSRVRDDFSADQLMIALYRTNPHAFGRSIGVVFEGAVLQLPDNTVIASLTPADAAAEVHRQMSIARAGGDSSNPVFDIETVVSAEDHELLKAQYW
ncbi:MAG: FimV/HubP family polar landmark protein [Woeseiaceae bacterium]|nr:FimV/HubP family polar landmark protein [Woeseiaceae bacterium]